MGTAACLAVAALCATLAAGLHPAAEPSRIDRRSQNALADRQVSRVQAQGIAALTKRSLAKRPLDAAALLRLAYVSSLTTGRLNDRANLAIERSYEVEPLGSEVTLWRLGFVFDNWSTAAPEVRRAAMAELEAVYPRRSWDFDAVSRTVSDPQGRMVATIATRRLRRQLEANAGSSRPS